MNARVDSTEVAAAISSNTEKILPRGTIRGGRTGDAGTGDAKGDGDGDSMETLPFLKNTSQLASSYQGRSGHVKAFGMATFHECRLCSCFVTSPGLSVLCRFP